MYVLYEENYIVFAPSTQNHGKRTFSTEQYGRNPAGEEALYYQYSVPVERERQRERVQLYYYRYSSSRTVQFMVLYRTIHTVVDLES
eukprot:COSAG02_NODE_5018_length_4721_cov_6.541108_6_plen_87_part_00